MIRTDLLIDPFDATWPEVLGAAAAAHDVGFAGLWTWDHLAGAVHDAGHVLECWTVLSAVAGAVPDLDVGPMVLNVDNRHPGVLAVMAATLQHVSGGRLLLGMGAGGGPGSPYTLEQTALGREVGRDPARRAAVEAAVAELRRVWAGGEAGFLRPDPPPPVIVGGFGPRMAELAGRVGDGLTTPGGAGMPRLLEIARTAHAAAGGDPARFEVVTTAPLVERWADPASQERQRLEGLGVTRVALMARPPIDPDRIREVGRQLS